MNAMKGEKVLYLSPKKNTQSKIFVFVSVFLPNNLCHDEQAPSVRQAGCDLAGLKTKLRQLPEESAAARRAGRESVAPRLRWPH